MNKMSSFKQILGLLLIVQVVYSEKLVATFNANDVIGSATISDYPHNSRFVLIKFSFNKISSNKRFAGRILKDIVAYEDGCNLSAVTIRNLGSIKSGTVVRIPKSILSVCGSKSALGRTIELYDLRTKLMTCSSFLSVRKTTYAKVVISNAKIAGSFEFLQGQNGDTALFGQVSRSDGSTKRIFNNKWFITNERECGESSTVYNRRCGAGDLTHRHGKITVGVRGSDRVQVVDSKLPLKNIISRTMVIMGKYGILGCGKIILSGPLEVKATFTRKKNKGISGSVMFKQQSPYHRTKLSVNLKGLRKRTSQFHVHEYPISDLKDKCSAASVGGHLNPFNVDIRNSPEPEQGSLDRYEIGDLSGKFGFLDGKDRFRGRWIDSNLPLYGENSVIGRSIVIHRPDTSRITCSNIEPRRARLLTGYVNFTANKGSVITGSVIMRQYKLRTGVLTPTLIVVDLKYRNDRTRKTSKHGWHVHIKPLGDDNGKICSSVLGHYNPAEVDVTPATYGNQCSGDFPHRCEIGDLSSKLGTYDIGGGKVFYADVEAPLFGRFSALGRSIVFHAPDKGSARLACANVIQQRQ